MEAESIKVELVWCYGKSKCEFFYCFMLFCYYLYNGFDTAPSKYRSQKEPPSTLLWTLFLLAQVC
jgi:hypothetical protein